MKLGHSADRHNVTPKFEKQNYQRDPSIPELRPLNCLNLMGGVHRCFALKARHFLLDLHETHKAWYLAKVGQPDILAHALLNYGPWIVENWPY